VDDPRRVGVVGLGVISRQYFATLAGRPEVRITAVADLDAERARAVAEELPDAVAMTVDELLASSEVDVVLNLTIPSAHADIALRAIAHGKDVYGEKPLAATVAEAKQVMDAAAAAGTEVWCAPDTVLGTGIQTARAAVESGAIGHVVGASAVMTTPGHEAWHPNPDFYYRAGGGPLWDMGPYYLTALLHLLGPVAAATGVASRPRSERAIGSGPRAGERMPVEVDTHIVALLAHASGAITSLTMSFDAAPSRAPHIELFGSEGVLLVPDPNNFDGEVRLGPLDRKEPPAVLPVTAGYPDAGRGIGLVDAVIGQGRASGEVALHVTEVMEAIGVAVRDWARVTIATEPTAPQPVLAQAGTA